VPHVSVIHRLGEPGVVDCKNPTGRGNNPPTRGPEPGPHDSTHAPDYEGPYCAGEQVDPFPSATGSSSGGTEPPPADTHCTCLCLVLLFLGLLFLLILLALWLRRGK
jgi:hypothetical protein